MSKIKYNQQKIEYNNTSNHVYSINNSIYSLEQRGRGKQSYFYNFRLRSAI